MRDTLEKEGNEKKNTTTPSIIDTDAEDSDSGDIIREITEPINTNEVALTSSTDDAEEGIHTSKIVKNGEQDIGDGEGCETSDIDESALKQSPVEDLPMADTTWSSNSDEPTDDSNNRVTRGTQSRLVKHVVVSAAETAFDDQNPKENQNDSSSLHNTDICCHPSKLAHHRGDSISALQPSSIKQHTMSPNLILPTKGLDGPGDQNPEFRHMEAEENKCNENKKLNVEKGLEEDIDSVSFASEKKEENGSVEEQIQVMLAMEREKPHTNSSDDIVLDPPLNDKLIQEPRTVLENSSTKIPSIEVLQSPSDRNTSISQHDGAVNPDPNFMVDPTTIIQEPQDEQSFEKKDEYFSAERRIQVMLPSEKEETLTDSTEDIVLPSTNLNNEMTQQQNSSLENSPVRTRGTTDIPQPLSGRVAPFSQHDGVLNRESNLMISPPPSVIIQQSQGDQAFYPTTTLQHHGSFGYTQMHPTLQVPVVQQGIPSNISAMQQMPAQVVSGAPMNAPAPSTGSGGRRKISLKLEEDAKYNTRRSFFFRRKASVGESLQSIEEPGIDRGTITVSWFEGTSTSELQEHVRNSVMRKLHIDGSTQLVDIRIIDRSEDPPQEIVLSPFIPDGSNFVLRFSSQRTEKLERLSPSKQNRSALSSMPVSPSAAPSPYPSNLDLSTLNAKLLTGKLDGLKPPDTKKSPMRNSTPANQSPDETGEDDDLSSDKAVLKKKVDETDTASKVSEFHEDDVMGYNPEDQIEARLRQLADLLIADRKSRRSERRTKEKRQVVIVIINYLGFFLALIALSAELSARAPEWLTGVENHFKNVQKCSKDQDALFECVSEGDFAGLVASFVLWLGRSTSTKRFFLFGFETPKKLWTVVYESLVTAVCWGASYILIRRGMNPDTRSGFVRKYWKDAVYGSLAGFNASFMKQVLKNLIPQEALEDALQERQLKILSWLPSFH